jgi:glycosyltransferase involved in cell wall biosynthesis
MPAYNAAATIGSVVREALQYMPKVLVADDGSNDRTGTIAAEAGGDVIAIDHNRGKGYALKVLFQRAMDEGYDAVISMDADGQHDPREIPRFAAAHAEDPQAVIVGSRMHAKNKIPRARYNSMHVARFFISLAANQFIEDTQCGYRLYPLSLIKKMRLTQGRYVTESEILIKTGDLGERVATIPIGTIYGDHVSHFRPVIDVTFITAYIISYKMIKYGIEAFCPDRPYTYTKDNLRDWIARNEVIDYIFKTITPCTIIPAMFVYLGLYTVLPFFIKNNFASVRRNRVGFYRLALATAMLPVILIIIIFEKLVSYAGIKVHSVDEFIQTFYPHVWV